MKSIKRYFLQITLSLILLLQTSCGKDLETSLPYVAVNFSVSLNIYNDLRVPGNVVYFSGKGYGGILVINTGFGYYAYDAACPYEADVAYLVGNEGGIGTCSGCGSKYNLLDMGLVMTGPSSESLLRYSVTATENYLYITNY